MARAKARDRNKASLSGVDCAQQQDLAEAARDQRVKIVERKEAKLAELEEERTLLGEESEECSDVAQQLARYTAYIEQNERFVDKDPDLAKIVEVWRSKKRTLQAQRNGAKPRDQRLRELLSDVASTKKELARQQDLAEAARVGMEAAKTAHEERVKIVERKEAKLAELEEERTQLVEESPPAGAPKDEASEGSVLTKQQLADILAAAGGDEAAQGERLDQSWAKYQEAVEAKKKLEQEQRKQEEQQKSAAMDVDACSVEELQSSLDGMLEIDGVEIPPSLREAFEKRKAQLVEAAKAKRQRV